VGSNTQLGIPGTAKVGQGVQARRAADKPLRPKTAQRDAGGLPLFGDRHKQKEILFDKQLDEAGIVKPIAPVKPTPPANPSQTTAQQPANQADNQKAQSITQRIRSQNPAGVQIDQLPNLVQQSASAMGVPTQDIPMMVELVKKQLGVGQPEQK
jgi:hypothetical protein